MYQWHGVLACRSSSSSGIYVHAGAYDDEEAAARAYDLAALKYWGPDTILNFPVPPIFTPPFTHFCPHMHTRLLLFPAENFQFGHGVRLEYEYQSTFALCLFLQTHRIWQLCRVQRDSEFTVQILFAAPESNSCVGVSFFSLFFLHSTVHAHVAPA